MQTAYVYMLSCVKCVKPIVNTVYRVRVVIVNRLTLQSLGFSKFFTKFCDQIVLIAADSIKLNINPTLLERFCLLTNANSVKTNM